MSVYVIEVEGLPPSLNVWYAGKHWSSRKREADKWHFKFLQAIRQANLPLLVFPVKITAVESCKRLRDNDNAVVAAKFFCDTLVRFGYLPNDCYPYIMSVHLEARKGKSDATQIIIEEEEMKYETQAPSERKLLSHSRAFEKSLSSKQLRQLGRVKHFRLPSNRIKGHSNRPVGNILSGGNPIVRSILPPKQSLPA